MRFDILNQFSDQQVVTATAVSTNSMAKKTPEQDLGVGGDPTMGLVFAASAVSGGASYDIELIEADNAALTTNVVSLSKMTVTAAEFAKRESYFLSLPGNKMTKKYFGARYTVTGGTSPSLTIDAYYGASTDVANYKSFKSSYEVKN